MWVVLSSMYGKLVVLLTIAFCLTEVMDNSILPLTFQVRSTNRQATTFPHGPRESRL